MFKDLRVVGLGASASYQPTIASILNPLNILKAINAMRYPPTKDILSGFEGVVRPGEMLCTFPPFLSAFPFPWERLSDSDTNTITR